MKPGARTWSPVVATILLMLGTLVAHGQDSERGRARVDVRATVMVIVRAENLVHPDAVEIDARDLERGFIDIDDAASLRLSSNSPSGFALAVAFDPTPLSRVDVRIRGRELAYVRSGQSRPIQAPLLKAEMMRVGFRLYLAPGAKAGRHRWPVALAFSVDP